MQDLIFQGEILGTQFEVEAGRSGRAAFKDLAARVAGAAEILAEKGWDGRAEVYSILAAVVSDGERETAAAGPHGAAIACIIEEVRYYAGRVNT